MAEELAKKVPIITFPTDTSLHEKKIGLYIDFYMNGMTLLHTKSYKITFVTAEYCISRKADSIIQELHTVTNVYKARGFNTNVYHWYNKLNIYALRYHIMPSSWNICAKGRHTPIIKNPLKPPSTESAVPHTQFHTKSITFLWQDHLWNA